MLYMDYNVPESKLIWNPESVYDIFYEKSWFDDPEIVRVACTVDHLDHTCDDIFDHEITGRCSGKDISGGAKTVILAYLGIAKERALPLSWLGENCFPVLGSLKIKDDIIFDGDSVPMLEKWSCNFISKRTGKVLNNYDDYYNEVLDYADES